jgi:hypothetical protein
MPSALIIPILKADAATRRVYARLDENIDRDGEAMDYEASKPVFKAWSDAQAAVTGGASFGNVRGQHGKVAAGIVSSIEFDDAAKTVSFGIDVVDDGEWEKVIKGVYTGISPGGRGKRYRDAKGVKRFKLEKMHELSLVDVPSLPGATFTLAKADGGEEEIALIGVPEPEVATPDIDILKAFASAQTPREYGAIAAPLAADVLEKSLGGVASFGPDVNGALFSAERRRELAASGAAMPDGSFPVTDQVDLEAGLAAIEKGHGTDAAREHLAARAKALDLADLLPAEMAGAAAPAVETPAVIEKGLGAVSSLSSLLNNLTWLAQDVAGEAAREADGSGIPGRLCAWLQEGASILTDMATEETAEAVAALQSMVATLPAASAPVMKAAGLSAEGLELFVKLAGERAALSEEIQKAHAATAAATAELERLRAMPAPGGARLLAVGRGDDVGTPSKPKAADRYAEVMAMPDGMEKARHLTLLAMAGAVPAART